LESRLSYVLIHEETREGLGGCVASFLDAAADIAAFDGIVDELGETGGKEVAEERVVKREYGLGYLDGHEI